MLVRNSVSLFLMYVCKNTTECQQNDNKNSGRYRQLYVFVAEFSNMTHTRYITNLPDRRDFAGCSSVRVSELSDPLSLSSKFMLFQFFTDSHILHIHVCGMWVFLAAEDHLMGMCIHRVKLKLQLHIIKAAFGVCDSLQIHLKMDNE